MIIKRRVLALFLVVLAGAAGALSSAKLAVSEGAPSEAGKQEGTPYSTINPRAGVWNDGQASFWDLPFIDHFIIFGAPERARGWAPEQPIKFSHVRHVQQNKMECQYCHWSVTKAAYAAIPEVETCVGCHKYIPGGSAGSLPGADDAAKKAAEEAKAEVKKILDYASRNEPIPWAKVHVMPDHVRFNHKRHVKAGVGCQECHGQIPAMPVVERVSSMKMGWCIDCHRAKGTSIDCTTCHK